MAHPLELSYNWRTPVLFATVGAFICAAALIRARMSGWLPALILVLALWVILVVLIYARTRAYLLADGSRLTVRRFRTFHTVQAGELLAVNQVTTPNGASYVLIARGADGKVQRSVAPTALLKDGRSTLFGWILARAPQAELDPGSRKTVEQLQTRGLLP